MVLKRISTPTKEKNLLTEINLSELRPSQLPHRSFAHPFDFKVDCDSAPHGVGRDPDSIDGCRAMGWYEVFRDYQTSEMFLVHCYDGENRGKLAHRFGHLRWMEEAQAKIIQRTLGNTINSPQFIVLSSAEWAIMRHRVFHGWLDDMDHEIANAMRRKSEGYIGKIRGVEVRVDTRIPNPLGEPVDLDYTDEEADNGRNDPDDHYESLAAAHGYEDY